jgi:heptosyltransferase I
MAKILIVRLGAMGDILHAMPTVTGIRAALPDATIGWLVEERWTELLAAKGQNCHNKPISKQKPVVNLIHTVNTRRWRRRFLAPGSISEMRRLLKSVREMRYDLALDFQGAIKSGFLSMISGASVKAGFVDPREPAARFFYSEKFPRRGEHVIEQNHGLAVQALTRYLNSDIEKLKLLAPQLPYDSAAEVWADSQIGQLGIASFVIVNPGAGWGAKQWPSDRYGQVVEALAAHNLKTLVNAAPGEESLAQQVVDAGKGHAFMVTGSIGELIALTRRARLFIGGDTGPLHLAAALGIPVVGLFGPTDPARTGPFGTRAVALRHPESQTTFSHKESPDDGLLKIEAGEVISAARWLLGSTHA